MRSKVLIITVILAVILSLLISAASVAAAPPDGVPGLARALEVKELHSKSLLANSGVAGVGVGENSAGKAAIIILTEKKGVLGLPASLDGIPVISVYSGKIYATPKPSEKPVKPPKDEDPELSPTSRWPRPVPIGVSTGHPAITAGTIGARVIDGDGNVYALSNNHVYADENKAAIGDTVIQPGTYDGGDSLDDHIGNLTAYVPITFTAGSKNYVDAAIASSTTTLLGNSTPSNGYGTPKSETAEAVLGMKVLKYGRTTGQTGGRIYVIGATVKVGYDSGVAEFDNQIIVTPGTFSAGGDSGSLIVVNNKRSEDHLKPVGLLFAGSSLYTIANPIDSVLAALGVTIDGQQ